MVAQKKKALRPAAWSESSSVAQRGAADNLIRVRDMQDKYTT